MSEIQELARVATLKSECGLGLHAYGGLSTSRNYLFFPISLKNTVVDSVVDFRNGNDLCTTGNCCPGIMIQFSLNSC